MTKWHYVVNKKPQGPASAEQIRDIIRRGQLTSNSIVWKEGFQDWIALQYTELGQLLSGPPPVRDNAPNQGHFNVNIELPGKFQSDHNIEQGVGLTRSNMQAIGHVATQTNVMAFVVLVLAISGFFIGITFIPAIVCGHIALSQYHRNPSIGGKGLAQAALIMRYIINCLGLIVLSLMFFWRNSAHVRSLNTHVGILSIRVILREIFR
ncbi:MAG: DUF4339 domain-containing protein [Candidatus Hydrogenedens sp.]|nr:DUF4339 domain-containing protein [Candidatus Hydrogenedens sp.]